MGYFHFQCICVYRDGEMYPHIVHKYMDYGHVIIVITFHVIMCVYICVYIACEYVCMYITICAQADACTMDIHHDMCI